MAGRFSWTALVYVCLLYCDLHSLFSPKGLLGKCVLFLAWDVPEVTIAYFSDMSAKIPLLCGMLVEIQSFP